MTKLTFHTKSRDVEVEGWELAQCESIVYDACRLVLASLSCSRSYVWDALARDITFKGAPIEHIKQFAGSSNGCSKTLVDAAGVSRSWLLMQHNTALATGNPMVQLAARIWSQSGDHAYIRATNKEWLAQLIELCIAGGFFRLVDYDSEKKENGSLGWLAVVDLLRENQTEDVVLSTSYVESFPNAGVLDWDGDEGLKGKVAEWVKVNQSGESNDEVDLDQAHTDIFDELDEDAQWDKAFAGLGSRLEWAPDTWDTFAFDDAHLDEPDVNGKSLLDLEEILRPVVKGTSASASSSTASSSSNVQIVGEIKTGATFTTDSKTRKRHGGEIWPEDSQSSSKRTRRRSPAMNPRVLWYVINTRLSASLTGQTLYDDACDIREVYEKHVNATDKFAEDNTSVFVKWKATYDAGRKDRLTKLSKQSVSERTWSAWSACSARQKLLDRGQGSF